MKRFLSVFLAISLMCTLAAFAYAFDGLKASESFNTPPTQEMSIAAIPADIVADYNRMVNPITRTAATEVSVMNEYQILQAAQEKTDSELLAGGYSAETIAEIRSGEAAERILEVTFERAALSYEHLANMGYSQSEIMSMKALTGNETLAEVSALGLLPSCTVSNGKISHTYVVSDNTTFFICSFGWEWDKTPGWLLTDCVGLGWNQDFSPNYNYSTSYNKCYKTYVNQSDASDKKYTTTTLYEKSMQTAEDKFDLNSYYGSDYYVKSGYGTMCLTQTGRADNAKFSCKYGHNQHGISPSVGYPWSISFSLEGAETIFQPTQLVYSATAASIE